MANCRSFSRIFRDLNFILLRIFLLAVFAVVFAGCFPNLISKNDRTAAGYLTVLGASPAVDGRARFRQILYSLAEEKDVLEIVGYGVEKILWRLDDEKPEGEGFLPLPRHDPLLRIVIVPGAFADCFSWVGMPFEDIAENFKRLGYKIDFIKTGGRSGSVHNARVIAEALRNISFEPDERILMVGHSKGVVDILHFLVGWPDEAKKISAVLGVAGPVMGSPLADFFSDFYSNFLSGISFGGAPLGDGKVVENLTRSYMTAWFSKNRLPAHAGYFSLAGFAVREDVHPLMLLTYDLLSSYDPRNDGYVAMPDQIIPGSVILGYVNLDHYDIALPVREKLNFFGQGSRQKERELIFEAAVLFIVESLERATRK